MADIGEAFTNIAHVDYGMDKWLHQYRQVSNIRRTKSQLLINSRTALWLSLPNPLKPDVKSRTKM